MRLPPGMTISIAMSIQFFICVSGHQSIYGR
jgi:hypothetical protein